jgi:hypothetical protein
MADAERTSSPLRRAPRDDVRDLITDEGDPGFAEGSSAAHAVAILRLAGSHPIVRGFPEGAIIVFDRHLRYLSAGGHGLSTVGLTREMIEGKSIYEVFPPAVSSTLDPVRKIIALH